MRHLLLLVLCFASGCAQQNNGSLPFVIPAVVGPPQSCSSQLTRVLGQVDSLLGNCSCQTSELWTRIAHLNMSDPDQQCPPNWTAITTPVRSCGRSTLNVSSTDSAIFPSHGRTYSRVCGRINAIQKGIPDAFASATHYRTHTDLESAYVDGVSVTHGQAGERQHIWTFAVVRTEIERNENFSCSCIDTGSSTIQAVPEFVGNNYFCDTGLDSNPTLNGTYPDNPLWDGDGCRSATNTCCGFNQPPYFCTELPQPTTDDIELRLCHSEPSWDEDTYVTNIDIYVL